MKTAVVTGGGSGIGRAVADRLRADGYHVATIDLNPSDDGFAHTADVTDRAQLEAALSAIRAQLGPVTILVNAAGLDGRQSMSGWCATADGYAARNVMWYRTAEP
jgi:2-hydroxycyclohexanecarboxyl-CoA dehydrogenase